MNNDQQYDQLKDLFEANLRPIRKDIADLTKAINGNGHKGILDRLSELEGFKIKVYTIYGVLATIFVVVSVYLKSFIEDVYQHIT
jgi:hypothetical protein